MSLRLAVVLWTFALALAGLAAGIVVSGGRLDHFVIELVLPIVGILTSMLAGLFGQSVWAEVAIFLALLAVPLSFLYGLLRERLARAAVERLGVHLGERPGPRRPSPGARPRARGPLVGAAPLRP